MPCDRVCELRTRRLFASIPFNRKLLMKPHRSTAISPDRSSGAVRRVTISLRSFFAATLGIFALSVLIGLGAKWSARTEIGDLQFTNAALEIENGSYRAATGELTTQIQSLEGVINELGARAEVDPAQARAMQKLPAVVKTRAAGGSPTATMSELSRVPLASPEDTFGVLRDLLHGLESRLRIVRKDVEVREALRSEERRVGKECRSRWSA